MPLLESFRKRVHSGVRNFVQNPPVLEELIALGQLFCPSLPRGKEGSAHKKQDAGSIFVSSLQRNCFNAGKVLSNRVQCFVWGWEQKAPRRARRQSSLCQPPLRRVIVCSALQVWNGRQIGKDIWSDKTPVRFVRVDGHVLFGTTIRIYWRTCLMPLLIFQGYTTAGFLTSNTRTSSATILCKAILCWAHQIYSNNCCWSDLLWRSVTPVLGW